MPFEISQGNPAPYGAVVHPGGVNFAFFIQGFHSIKLSLFDAESLLLFETFEIPFQTGQVKHLFVRGLKPPFAYCLQSDDPALHGILIFDPYAKGIRTTQTWGSKEPYRPFGLVLDTPPFDWENDVNPKHLKEDLMLYEMHVRGFTKRATLSRLDSSGTFLGVIEKIPYLQDLGINAIELMPMQEFDEMEYKLNPEYPTGENFQYWGYSTVNFFSPMNRYAAAKGPGESIDEFKKMVKALHVAGIEVILDMVLNHTSEGGKKGPIQSFKALAPHTYYIYKDESLLANYTGCGNTLSCNHPVMIEFILSILRYWVSEFHVDGFRFDLASIFYRGTDGKPLGSPPLIHAITKDPILAGIKLIAEPWDAVGLYQVGRFFPESTRWSEWNGKYRDCVRKFLRGERGLKCEFATRLSGSEDLYGHDRRLPRNSINFVTSHDGFSLRDLVSYNEKHNLNNGENNRDGTNHNDSWNCGIEGPTSDVTVNALRARQMRNFHLALMVSQGVPMLHMGDEYGHTKGGNNNTWCQDNELSWFLWEELGKELGFYRFYRGLIHFRKGHPLLRKRKFLQDPDIEWHGKEPFDPGWEKEDHFIAFTLIDKEAGHDLYIAFNASQDAVEIQLPKRKDGKTWHWVANTALPSPLDLQVDREEIASEGGKLKMESYSSLLLRAY